MSNYLIRQRQNCVSRALYKFCMQLTTAAAAAELPRDWRENHLNFSHYSSANPTTKVRNQLRPTVTQFYFRFTEDWLEITQFLKTVEGRRESTAKFGSKLRCATGLSEWGKMVGATKSQSWEYSPLPLVRRRMHTCNNVYLYSCTLQTHLEFLFYIILYYILIYFNILFNILNHF